MTLRLDWHEGSSSRPPNKRTRSASCGPFALRVDAGAWEEMHSQIGTAKDNKYLFTSLTGHVPRLSSRTAHPGHPGGISRISLKGNQSGVAKRRELSTPGRRLST